MIPANILKEIAENIHSKIDYDEDSPAVPLIMWKFLGVLLVSVIFLAALILFF